MIPAIILFSILIFVASVVDILPYKGSTLALLIIALIAVIVLVILRFLVSVILAGIIVIVLLILIFGGIPIPSIR